MNNFSDIPLNEIDSVLDQSNRAFQQYRLQPLSKRAILLRAVAAELEDMGDAWIETAHRETNLPPENLTGST